MQLFLLLALSLLVAADYHQDALWEGSNFFSNFNFVNAPDPTHGYVDFVSQAEAYSSGLVRDSSSPVYMGADHTNVASGSGRKSIRLESHTTWTVSPGSSTYLFVLDLEHMPTGCGTWPAWWFFGPNWPTNGEIDIIEGVHTQSYTQTTLHTNAGCGMGGQAGNWLSTVCESGGSNNAGCGQTGPGNSYGAPFNAHGGGVYAALWEHDRIAAFYFPRGGVPADLSHDSTSANPNSWGAPYATFPLGGNCPYNHFAQQAMTFDLTFCGDWAGATFGQACPGLGSCASYVQNNPGAFSEAYWSINFIKIFSQANGQNSAPAPSTVVPVSVPPAANAPTGNAGGNPPSGGSNNGCICQAKASADQGLVQQALDWACGQVDCSAINPGGAQYNPNTLQAHASYAFNAYYQIHSADSGSCNFNGAAQTVCGSSNPSPSPSGGSSGGSGCTCQAKSGADASALQGALDWACGQVDCSAINPGGAQYNPNTLAAHASYAFNAYFQQHSSDSGSCDFSGTATKVCGSSNPPPPPSGGSSGGSGCTCSAKPGADASALQGALDWACGQVDCSAINPGGAQYNPNTLAAHASYAFNAYFQQHSSDSGSCDFSGTAQKTCGSSNPPPPPPPTGGSSGGSGCTCQAKSGASASALQGGLDWACGQVDCSAINPGGAQYNPNTLQAHASYAYNAWYQKNNRDAGACDFSGTAQTVCGSSNPPPPPPPPTGGSSSSGCTCQAKSGADAGTLQGALDWACGQVDCSAINPGGAQYNPNTLQAHASYAFNAYFQKHSSDSGSCDFSGTAQKVCGSSNPPPPVSHGCTCSAKSNADAGTLQGALDWVCGQVNCAAINSGGANFNPNTLQAHASWAFNSYYQAHSSQGAGACDFSGTASLSCSGSREAGSSSDGGLSNGAIAGIVVGSVIGAALVVLIVVVVYTRTIGRGDSV